MRRAALPAALLVLVALGVTTAGCQTSGLLVVSRVVLRNQPLAVALVVDSVPVAAIAPLNPFPAFAPLQRALQEELHQPVAVDACFAIQAQQGLTNGWYALAVVTPAQYARLDPAAREDVLAVSVDRQGRTMRDALLIVGQRSNIRTLADLRGKVVAFGPQDDSRTHHAAVQMLHEGGIEPTDLSLEVIPIPGALKHMPDSRAVAQSVMNDSSAAGFVDEAAWEAFPETTTDATEPCRSKFRIVGRTIALPSKLVLASAKLDTRTRDRVRAFLLNVGNKSPDALEPLGASGYVAPGADVLAACRSLALTASAPSPAREARPVGKP